MTPYLWLSRFILLATVASPSLSNVFDLEVSSIWNNRATDIEAIDFFRELEKDENLRGFQRSEITKVVHKPVVKERATKKTPKSTKSTKKHHVKRRRGGHVKAAKRDVSGKSVDVGLNEIQSGLTLSKITGEMFSGDNFVVKGEIEDEDGKSVLTASPKIPIHIPGGDLVFEEVDGSDALVLKVTPGEATFETTEIKMEGQVYFSSIKSFKVTVEIDKDADSDVFKITRFDVADQALQILDLLGAGADIFNQLSGMDVKTDYLEKIKEQFSTFSGFGAFNKDSLQLVIQLDDKSPISVAMSAKSVSFLVAQDGEKTPRQLSVFVAIEDFIAKLGNVFDQSELFETNFILKNLGGEVCVFLVSANIEYLDPIKSDERLLSCFGNQEEDRAAEAFAEVEAGLHAHFTVDFQQVLWKGCFTDSEELPTELEDISSVVQIYAKITKKGVDCNILSDVNMPVNVITACLGGLLKDGPEYLTNGVIKLKHLTRVKAGEGKDATKHWKISVTLTPADGKLPGTDISITNLDLDAEGDEGDKDSWNVEAKVETTIGSESNLDLTIKKEGTEYFIEATSSKITFGDLLAAFSVPGVSDTNSQGVLKSLGVKDFLFSMKFGKELPEHEFVVNGKPIIFGFDKLEIAAIITKKKNGGSKRKKRAAAEKRGKKKKGKKRSSLTYTVGLYLNGADFTPLMKNVFNREDIDLEWLGGLKALVVFTNDMNNVVLKGRVAEEDAAGGGEDGEDAAKDGEDKKKRLAIGKLTKRHTKIGKRVEKVMNVKKEEASLVNLTTANLPQVLQKKKFIRTKRDDEEVEEKELTFDDLHEKLEGKVIEKAITFAIIWVIPTEDEIDTCHDNGLCKWMVENIKNQDGTSAFISIVGELGGGVFKLDADLEGMKVPFKDTKEEKLFFTGMHLGIEVGATVPSVEIAATMEYENTVIGATGDNKLTFTGSISATPISMSLLFTMEGFVYPKFGGEVAYIAIGDVSLGGGYSGGVPSFTFGAAIKLGLFEDPPKSDHAIVIRGYFGISVGNPSENWVYGSISSLNIEAVCTAFKLECSKMPENVKKTGFPNGISASFSNEEREVLGVGTIPQGLQIKGTLNIFGFEVNAELTMAKIGDGYMVDFLIEMSPLDWGNGMILVQRGEDDKENGPIASMKISTDAPEDFRFCIEGYASLLSIMMAEVKIDITAEYFYFKISGFLIPAFLKASVELKARYGGGGDSDDPLFSFNATVSACFSKKLKKIIVDFMKDLQQKVERAFDNAKKKITAAQDKVTAAQKTVEGWETSIEKWKTDLQTRKEKIQRESEPPKCVCPKVCFQFFDWDSKCWKIWGYWVGCPWWNSCFSMIDDIFCKAGCAIKKVISTIIRWAKQAILSLGQLILSGVQGLLALARGIMELAKGVLEVAKGVLWLAKKAITGGLQLALDAFLKLLENFALYKLQLTATLSADYSACVGYAYHILFFGKDQKGNGEACLDLSSLSGALIGGVTEDNEETKGATETPERLKEVATEEKEVDAAEVELNSEEADAKSKITEDVGNKFDDETKRDDIPTLKKWARSLERVPRHHHVPTREDIEISKLVNKKIPRYDVQADPEIQRFVKKSPWNLPSRHVPIGHNVTVRHEETESGQKRTLDFDTNLTPCTRMKRALQGYSDLTDGIIKYSQAVQSSSSAMEKSRIAGTEKLDQFERVLKDADAKHNMTTQDREDAYYLYNNLAHRHEELVRKSQIAAHTEDAYAMPIIRRQINHLLGKEKGSTFMKFTDIMHLNAVEGYKRSQIPHPADVQGERILGNIKQGLQAIVTNEDSALTPMTYRVQNVKKDIIAMSEYVKTCRDT